MPSTILSRPRRAVAVEMLRAASLPVSDLTDVHMEHFYYCGPESSPFGLVGFELCGTDALLRSLAVAPEQRQRGLGHELVAHAESEARARGANAMYLLTTTAAEFFIRRGYVTAERDHAPAGIRATQEFAGICPASSAFMMKKL